VEQEWFKVKGLRLNQIQLGKDAELIRKIEGDLQELEEMVYCLEMLVDSGIIKIEQMAELMKEADELIVILVSSAKTIEIRKNRQ
jgi:four helix bundle protein